MGKLFSFARRHVAVSVLIAASFGATACEDAAPRDLPSTPPEEAPPMLPGADRGSFDVELPTLASRLSFHAVGNAVVGGAAAYDIRAVAGEVVFTPGVRSEDGGIVAGTPLRLRTTRVDRDGSPSEVRQEQEASAGALLIHHGVATERWINGADGAEQSFHFSDVPEGDGDLVVEIATAGLGCVESTDAGLRFASEDGRSGVRYGHGTFIDADGVAARVPASCSAESITLRVPASVVDAAAYPAVLDPVVEPSFELTPPVPGSTNGYQQMVACSDTTCLLVFNDNRDGTLRRFAGRFTPGGTVLDQVPHPLGGATTTSDQYAMVAFIQDRFLVVYRQGATLFAQFIAETGALLGGPITLAGDVSLQPDVGCGPSDCLVAWVQGGNILAATRIAPDGTVLDGSGFVVASPGYRMGGIAWAQGRYFIPYRPSSGLGYVYGKRIENGVVLDTTAITLATESSSVSPHLATDGTNFFVTTSPNPGTIRGTLVSNDGVVMPPGMGFTIENSAYGEDLVWNGTDFSMLFRTSSVSGPLRGKRVSPAGVVDPQVVDVSTTLNPTYVSAAPINGGGAVVTMSYASGWLVRPVEARRLDEAGQPTGDQFRVANGFNNQRAPAVAAGGGQYLVAWLDRRLASAYAVATRVDANGTVLDPQGILIAELDAANTVTNFATAGVDATWNGSSFLVVWTDQTNSSTRVLRGARVDANGAVMDATPFAIGGGFATRPSIAWNGTVHMVTWKNSGTNASYYVARIGANGTALDPSGIQLGTTTSAADPLITWTGAEFLVIAGAGYRTVNGNGVPLQGSLVAHGAGISPYSMACNGTSCSFTGHAGSTLRSVPFNAATKTSGAAVTIATTSDVPSATAWDGSRTVVVYGSNDLRAWTAGATTATVAVGPELANAPRLASLGAGDSFLAYTLADEVPGSVSRIYASIVAGGADPGAPCLVAADCASNFCTDGVCCNVACTGGTTDCQACSVAAGAPANGTCAPISPTTVCRSAAGPCDVAETCDGVNAVCPSDQFAAGTVCRAANGSCDAAEQCTGAGIQCPADSPAPSGTVCRASVGECDVTEACNGSSFACPADSAIAPGTACIGTPSDCVTSVCSGIVGATAFCRQTPKLAGTVCRAPTGTCDIVEVCNGTPSPCPEDQLKSSGAVCRASGGGCDLAETCDGASGTCPDDAKVAAGTECRPSTAECDVVESCDGIANACPTDLGAAQGTLCGADPVGPCQLPSTCAGGTSKLCRTLFEPMGTECRGATGPCDAIERCSGASAECPADMLRSAGEVCSPKDRANSCDVDDVCDGSTLACAAIVADDGADCETEDGADGTCGDGECIGGSEGGSGGDGGAGGAGGALGGSNAGGSSVDGGSGGIGGDLAGGEGGDNGTGGDAGHGGGDGGDQEGCSCRAAGATRFSSSATVLAFAAAALSAGRWLRRRRRVPTAAASRSPGTHDASTRTR